jgi:outer membrane biosynthesis protein TonB
MHDSESRASRNQRFIWAAVFAAALWLTLVNAGVAFAGGEHWQGQSSSSDDQNAGLQHTDGDSGSWKATTDEGHHPPKDEGHPPPEGPAPEEPCDDEGHKPPETPPGHDTPPEETPPVETPPEQKPPEEKPPVETPPVQPPPEQAPPVQAPPVQAPPVETPPTETPTTPESPESPAAPREREGGGGEVRPQEQNRGGGNEAPTGGVTEVGAEAAPAVETLPFTGSPTPLLVLFGGGLLGLGVGLRRVTAERG